MTIKGKNTDDGKHNDDDDLVSSFDDDDASNDAPASAGVLVVRASSLLQGVDGLLETIRDLSVVELVAPEANVRLK